jgi:hypothetical protein
MPKTTILIETDTRELLKLIGSKGQTYDQVINGLIKINGEVNVDGEVESLPPGKSSMSGEVHSHGQL